MNTTQQPVAPATEKQLSYLDSLLSTRDHDNLTVQMAQMLRDSGSLNVKLASAAITDLVKLPAVSLPKAKAQAAAPAAPAPVELIPGVYDSMPSVDPDHFTNGRYYIIYKTKYGSLAAKRLYKSYETKSGYSWRKVGLYVLKSYIAKGMAVRLEKGVVAKLGKKFNFCMCCGATLTDPQSVADGIGPVCAANYGYGH